MAGNILEVKRLDEYTKDIKINGARIKYIDKICYESCKEDGRYNYYLTLKILIDEKKSTISI